MSAHHRIAATDGGDFGAYVALPEVTPAPGIVMLHEIFGVTDWVTETADLFAGHGYCVAAPEMFWRLEPDFKADHNDPEQREQGLRYRGEIDHDKAVEDIAAVIAHLKSMPECNGKIGVTGFCMGGTLTYLAAARLNPDAAVAYYGTEIHNFLDEGKNISCPTLLHAGDKDGHVPMDLVNEIAAALDRVPDVEIEIYDAGHAFANTHRPNYFVPDEAQRAHNRTFEVFDRLR